MTWSSVIKVLYSAGSKRKSRVRQTTLSYCTAQVAEKDKISPKKSSTASLEEFKVGDSRLLIELLENTGKISPKKQDCDRFWKT